MNESNHENETGEAVMPESGKTSSATDKPPQLFILLGLLLGYFLFLMCDVLFITILINDSYRDVILIPVAFIVAYYIVTAMLFVAITVCVVLTRNEHKKKELCLTLAVLIPILIIANFVFNGIYLLIGGVNNLVLDNGNGIGLTVFLHVLNAILGFLFFTALAVACCFILLDKQSKILQSLFKIGVIAHLIFSGIIFSLQFIFFGLLLNDLTGMDLDELGYSVMFVLFLAGIFYAIYAVFYFRFFISNGRIIYRSLSDKGLSI